MLGEVLTAIVTPFDAGRRRRARSFPVALPPPRRERVRRPRRDGHDRRGADAHRRRALRSLRGGAGRGRLDAHGDRRHGHVRHGHSMHLTTSGARDRRPRLPRRDAVLQQAAAARHRRPRRGDRGRDRPARRLLRHPEPGRRRRRAGDDLGAREDPERPRRQAGEAVARRRAPRRREGLDLYAGDDDLIFPFLEVGGIGGICVNTHVVGQQVKEMVTRFRAGDVDGGARDRRGAAPGDRAPPRADQPDPDQDRAEPAGPRRRRVPPAARRRDARRGSGRSATVSSGSACSTDCGRA